MSAFHPTFVSHAHVDNDLCDRYVAALRGRGIDIWYDRNNAQAGHFLDREIEQQLEQRSAFVLLMTQQALDSFWVQQELGAYRGLMGRDRSRLLLPVRIGPCNVPPLLNALLWIDALAMPFDQAIDAIASALTATAAPAVASPLAPPPQRDALPPLGPAPAPANSAPAHHLTPMSLYSLGFRGYSVGGVECILPPICPVPAGIFTMGSDKVRDKDAEDREMPQYPVEVDGFAIGQHPVTVAEYACAVRAKGVSEPPASEFLGTKVDWTTQQTYLDHPVVCVTWNDVVAYCAWLAKTTSQPWRLPSEAEWEKAARGADGRIYPWGDTLDELCCNTRESGNGMTTPVGRYPNGESPYHVQDMAGNAWEWSSTMFQLYPYRINDGRENLNSTDNRVLRGGSWNNVQQYARAAHRYNGWPSNLNASIGFRLALPGS
ncbi:MAG TPA: SUMF1/EgtB/PvdO family nonheme iron enzyme [Ktedonobacterales bacterium]|jgi:formylglycine-generating enzyme required for sulfatase activity